MADEKKRGFFQRLFGGGAAATGRAGRRRTRASPRHEAEILIDEVVDAIPRCCRPSQEVALEEALHEGWQCRDAGGRWGASRGTARNQRPPISKRCRTIGRRARAGPNIAAVPAPAPGAAEAAQLVPAARLRAQALVRPAHRRSHRRLHQEKLDQAMLDELEDILIRPISASTWPLTVTARCASDRFDRDISGEEVRALELLRPVACERLEEVLLRPGREIEQVRPDARRARGPRRLDDLGQLLGPVGEPGQDRRHADARLDAGVDERAPAPAAAGAAAPCRARSSARRRGRASGTEKRDADVGAPCRLAEHVDVADDQRPAGDDHERRAGAAERLDAGPRQAVAPLRRLIRVGGGADRDRLARPRAVGRAPSPAPRRRSP